MIWARYGCTQKRCQSFWLSLTSFKIKNAMVNCEAPWRPTKLFPQPVAKSKVETSFPPRKDFSVFLCSPFNVKYCPVLINLPLLQHLHYSLKQLLGLRLLPLCSSSSSTEGSLQYWFPAFRRKRKLIGSTTLWLTENCLDCSLAGWKCRISQLISEKSSYLARLT